MPSDENVLELFRRVKVWRQGDRRAPHKPLLLLFMLARVQRRQERLVRFADIEEDLRQLLKDFGPDTRAVHPEYAFWRLRNDGVWEVEPLSELEASQNASGDVSASVLRRASGGLKQTVYEELTSRPSLLRELAIQILTDAFPASMHASILDRVRLHLGLEPS